MGKYFGKTLADEKGLSGDDQNRRHRERRLGFGPADPSWADCKKEIRCLWNDQVMHRPALDDADIHVHASVAFFQPLYANGDPMIAPIRVIS